MVVALIASIVFQVDGNWSVWEPWSTCSVTCGTERQYRRRKCNNPERNFGGNSCSGPSRETKPCLFLQSCPGNSIVADINLNINQIYCSVPRSVPSGGSNGIAERRSGL